MSNLAARRTFLRDHLERGLEHIHDHALVLMDEDGRIAGWNEGAARLLGYCEQQVVGQPHDLFFTPEDRQAGEPQRELHSALAQGHTAHERWHLRRDGSRFFGSATVAAAREDGALLGFVKIFRDLTAQRRAVEQLAESEARYRLLVTSIKDHAIYMLDADGRVSYWTQAAERIKGYTADEVVGQPFALFFTPEDLAEQVPERELQTAREQGSVEGAGWRVRKDGSRFWGEEIATAIFDASGTFVGYSKITRDMTERRAVELERERLLREATEANRLKDEFLSTMSHELRTPLNAILGWLQLLRLRNEVPEHLREALAVVERNARAQGRLIEDLLDASRIVTGHESLALRPVAFAEPLAAAVETVKPSAFAKNVSLDLRHDITSDEVMADAERLQQIIWNLLANAIKFTPSGGRVSVATRDADPDIELSVVDTGMGIAPEFLPFVFDRFRQADTARSRVHGGLGLGLSIVKHLVDLHGGHIAVESAGGGQGTTVRLRIPRRRQADARGADTGAPSGAARASLELSGVSVLVVDDDADGRRMLDLALSAQGAHVMRSASASDGLAALRAAHPDVVLADLAMPGEDGFYLLSRLRADSTLGHLPVVAITAHTRDEDRVRCLAAGFDAFLAKPVDINEVIDTVARLAASRLTRSEGGGDGDRNAQQAAEERSLKGAGH